MTTSGAGQAEEAQQPSYEALRSAERLIPFSLDAQRIFWSLNGPLATSIEIMEGRASDPDSPREAYFRQTTGGVTSWHPASQSPLTEPKVSSITVRVRGLELWEDDWLDKHRDHADPDDEENRDNDDVQFGVLHDYDPDSDEEGPDHLLVCCGMR
jgi:hypothetical protein